MRKARELLSELPKSRPYWKRKNLSRAERMIRFVEWLPCSSGKNRGKKIKLLPFQRQFIENTFADDANGNPKISISILSTPKGSGKTTLAAAIACAYLFCEPFAQERGEIYVANVSKEKARKLFDEVVAIIHRTPEFAMCNPIDSEQKIVVLDGPGLDSKFESIAATEAAGAGLLASIWIYDETGESSDNGKLLNALIEGDGKRGDDGSTLGICISTQASSNDHHYSKLIDDALKGEDPSTYIQLHTAPIDADPFSDETLLLANPAAGHFLNLPALQKAAARAKRIPSMEASFRRLRLNQRVETQNELRLVTGHVWKECGKPVRPDLKGKRCFGGLDLSASARGDLTAFTLVFPDDATPEVGYDVLTWCWTPLAGLEDRPQSEQENFRNWIERGYLRPIEGKIIRLPVVAADVKQIAADYDIRCIGYDSWHIEMLMRDLEDIGVDLPLEKFTQGHSKAMAPAVEFLQEAALTGRLRHGNNPVLTAAMTNAIVVPDRAGNAMIDIPK